MTSLIAELGPGDPAGLCPKCLIQGAFDSSVGAEESATQTIDTAAATRWATVDLGLQIDTSMQREEAGIYQLWQLLAANKLKSVYLVVGVPGRVPNWRGAIAAAAVLPRADSLGP